MAELKFAAVARTKQDELTDHVYAALETGNPTAARLALKEMSELYPISAARLSMEVRKEYGVVL